jgi:hypothetical protein
MKLILNPQKMKITNDNKTPKAAKQSLRDSLATTAVIVKFTLAEVLPYTTILVYFPTAA